MKAACMTKPIILTLIAIFLSMSGCSKKSSSVPPILPQGSREDKLPQPLSEKFPIDGVVDLSAFPTVYQATVPVLSSFGDGTVIQTSNLRWAATNDDRNLYIALEWTDSTENSFYPESGMDDFDGIVIAFDNDADGVLEQDEDCRRLIMTKYGSFYSDLHADNVDDDDAVGDGMGKMTYTAADHTYHAEFLIPLSSDAANQDGLLNAETRYNIVIYDHMQIPAAGNIGAVAAPASWPFVGLVTTAWMPLPFTPPTPHDQPSLPAGLTGLIVYISDKDNPLGELYTFDPVTRLSTRVTHTTGLYMDCASLSHDWTKIAIHSAQTSTDFANFEIRTVDVGTGTNLVTLTTNSVLDGHPAWSPHDDEIVYASFYDTNKAKLIISTPTGSILRSDLTPLGQNDNDPDWLPDGRIVFKTDRWVPGSPQVRIGVMNPDGTGVTQLTSHITGTGTSDHDPVSTTGTTALFERFMKGTDYAADFSFMYTPWNIVEARIDGSGERTLVADGWVNWLPVHDPTGRYIVYLKTVGYTEARLMTRDGKDLGRLIPDDTKIRYIDWK